jgi:hypothetical protein
VTIYGADYYGQDPNGSFVYYGLTYPYGSTKTVPAFLTVDPFIATSIDYSHILLNWTQPAQTGWSDFRLLSNRYGFPVDENDGTLLIDAGGPNWPGSSYLDSNVIPGTYHHYAIYLLVTEPPSAPILNSSYTSAFTDGAGASSVLSTLGTTTSTPNIPVGTPYPYGFQFVSNPGAVSSLNYPYNSPINITPSTQYTVTAWVYSTTGEVFMGMNWQNAGSLVSSNTNTFSVPVNQWTQISSTVTSPSSGAVNGSAIIQQAVGTNYGPYGTFYATGIVIQKGVQTPATATPAQTQWVRAGIAACLAPTDYNSTQFLIDTIPEFYKQGLTGDLTTDENGNSFLNQYLSIIAWSIDYLKTALFITQNINNPDIIPLNDLYNLALTVGFPYEPEISAGIIRMGIQNVAQLVQQRGTPEGIAAYTSSLAGFSLDLTVGYNIMLDVLQSTFDYPTSMGQWNANQTYQIGDIVDYGNYKYVANVASTDLPPTGLNSNNTQWNVFYYTSVANSPGYITNPLTNWPSTWEPRWASASNEYPNDVTALREAVGILDPTLSGALYLHKGLKIKNNSGGTTTTDIRSVSRLPSDITLGNAQPDPSQVINDGVPVPFTIPQDLYSATTAYETGQIVTYQGLPFMALKASTNIAPSSNYTPSNEWQPLGYDGRCQLMTSMYTMGDLSASVQQVNIQPYVSFYDQYGIHIADLLCRSQNLQVNDVSCAATTNQSFNHTSSTILTASANGVTTIDGVTITAIGQGVLLAGQTSALDNGYYAVTTVGTVSVATVLTRYGTGASSYPGSYVYVESGTANGGKTYYCTNTSTPTLGTTALTFSATASAGYFYPNNIMFDSFAKPSDWGSNVTLHTPEVGLNSNVQYAYTAASSNFVIDAFTNGVVRPANPNTQCLVYVPYASANTMTGITIVTTPIQLGFVQGLACRVASASSYIRIDQNAIVENNGGTYTVLVAHSVPAAAGDRLTAICNGNTITAYINGTQVSTTSTSFNNSQVNFGFIYETSSTVGGVVQPRATLGIPRRRRSSIRARINYLQAPFIWKLTGTIQPRTTVPIPRRVRARAFVKFLPVTTVNRPGPGNIQPAATQPHQRLATQRARAWTKYAPVKTTNVQPGQVQPDPTVMLPRRKSTRAYIHGTPLVYTYHTGGSVQPEATLAHQRTYLQRHRGFFGPDFSIGLESPSTHVPGRAQRTGYVIQRPANRRSRAVVNGRYAAAANAGPGTYGPAGQTQRTGYVAQRNVQQRERASVGYRCSVGAGHGATVDLQRGTVQARPTIAIPRRRVSRAVVGNNIQLGDGQPGTVVFGPSGVQPLASKPSQRAKSQRSRAVINGRTTYEIGPEQPRGGNGKVQPRPVVARRASARAYVMFKPIRNIVDLGVGQVQPRATVPVPRRRATRAFVKFTAVTTMNKAGWGTVQPRPVASLPRRKSTRAYVKFTPVKTTDQAMGQTEATDVVVRSRSRSRRGVSRG